MDIVDLGNGTWAVEDSAADTALASDIAARDDVVPSLEDLTAPAAPMPLLEDLMASAAPMPDDVGSPGAR